MFFKIKLQAAHKDLFHKILHHADLWKSVMTLG